jgi:branched-chain amino acid transport system ATP-binding protein
MTTPAASEPRTLSIENLCLERGGRPVLHDVSVEVPTGAVTAMLGPNGAGKSSLVLAIGGTLRPSSGSIRLGDQQLTGLSADKVRSAGVAVVPEGRKLLPDLTVEENLRVATYRQDKRRFAASVERTLELFPELRKRWTVQARALSGGEQQMVVLAQAVVSDPAIVVVDELSLGLAPVVVKRLVPLLQGLADQGIGVLLIEQFVNVALQLADNAYVMESGRIRFRGPAADLDADSDVLRSAYLLAQ